MMNDWLKRRLHGQLPRIDIDGENYIIDWRLKQLRHSRDLSKTIDLNRLDMNEDGTEYICLYDRRKHEAIYQLQGGEQSEDLVSLHIPYELKLDPVAVAREYGLKDIELLQAHTSIERQNARIRPLEAWQKKLIKEKLKDLQPDMVNQKKRKQGLRF